MDKKAKLKIFGLLLLILIGISLIVIATDFSDRIPADGNYDLDGVDIIVNITVTPTLGNNITNISLWTNIGTWSRNQTLNFSGGQDTPRIVGFVINALPNASLADGTDLIWGIEVGLNASNSTYGISFSSNRTINIEYPPNITLNLPANSSWQSSNTLNFTVISKFTSGTGFTCQLLTNETGNWLVQRTVQATNNTDKTLNYQFEELSDIRWGFRCQENTDANVINSSVNNTIRIDRTNPFNFSVNNVSTNSYHRNKNITLNFTFTELNPATCGLYANGTLNTSDDELPIDGNLSFNAGGDGVYRLYISCNDSANNRGNTSNILITTDTVTPQINNVGNFSVINSSDKRRINFSSNEDVNVTINYGTTTAVASSVSNSTFASPHNIRLSDLEENTIYYFNITVCDRAGNCNGSSITYGLFDFLFPFKLRTGWSYYGIYDSRINFSDILSASGTEYVYYWNQTKQEWIFATAGGTSNMGFEVGTVAGNHGNRHVVALYEETNSTWARNVSTITSYVINLTTGHNFLKMYDRRTIGKLTESMLNVSILDTDGQMQYGSELQRVASSPNAVLTYNMTQFFYAAYNNSATDWTISYTYNFSKNNATIISNVSISEVAWVFSPRNLTWNGSNIMTNWTI